jgi:hypothetical protein
MLLAAGCWLLAACRPLPVRAARCLCVPPAACRLCVRTPKRAEPISEARTHAGISAARCLYHTRMPTSVWEVPACCLLPAAYITHTHRHLLSEIHQRSIARTQVRIFLFEKACAKGTQLSTLGQATSRIRRALSALCARTYVPTRRNDAAGADASGTAETTDAIARDVLASTDAFRGHDCVVNVAVAPAVAQAVQAVAGEDALNAAVKVQAGLYTVATHVLNPCYTRMTEGVWRDAEEARKGEQRGV